MIVKKQITISQVENGYVVELGWEGGAGMPSAIVAKDFDELIEMLAKEFCSKEDPNIDLETEA